ncbi:hypothetical protein IWQ61_010338, partial [Dispira simplex]
IQQKLALAKQIFAALVSQHGDLVPSSQRDSRPFGEETDNDFDSTLEQAFP